MTHFIDLTDRNMTLAQDPHKRQDQNGAISIPLHCIDQNSVKKEGGGMYYLLNVPEG